MTSARSETNAKLLQAIRRGEAGTVSSLLAAGADPDAADAEGRTALIYAASINMSNVRRGEIVAALLKQGADPDRADARGKTPLHEAAVSGQWDVMTALLERGANINAQSSAGATPLHAAASIAMVTGRLETLDFLLKSGANSAFRNEQNLTALELAVKNPSKMIYASTVASRLQAWDDAKPDDVKRADIGLATQREQREAARLRESQLRETARKAAARLKLKP